MLRYAEVLVDHAGSQAVRTCMVMTPNRTDDENTPIEFTRNTVIF